MELKPLIHRLYIEENQTLSQIRLYLARHHGFTITNNQFNRRVREWGFRKNGINKEVKLHRAKHIERVDNEYGKAVKKNEQYQKLANIANIAAGKSRFQILILHFDSLTTPF